MDPLNLIEESDVYAFNATIQSTIVSGPTKIQKDPMDPFNLPSTGNIR